jgi:hypothetical protein
MGDESNVSAWWIGLEPAEVAVRCGGTEHPVRWRRGELVACEHGDPDDERTFAALAGDRCPCVELLDAWNRHVTDLRALKLAPRDISDPVRSSAWISSPGARGGYVPVPAWETRGLPLPSEPRVGRFPVYPRSWDDSEAELIALLGLGGELGERLVATVAASWARRLRDSADGLPAFRPRLQAALHGRVLATLRTWLQEPTLTLSLEMTAEDGARSVSRAGGRVYAQLPFAWLAEVWCKRLPTVGGELCLAAQATDGDDGIVWRLSTLARDLQTLGQVHLDGRAAAA